VAPVAVAVGYGRGAFSQTDVARTAEAVAAFAPLIVVMMCYAPFLGALNARRRGGVLLAGGVINACLNLLLDIVLGVTLGSAGIALSTSLTGIVVLAFFSRRLARSEEDFALAPIWRTLVLAVAASLSVALPIALLCWLRVVPDGPVVGLLALFLFGTLGLLGYLLVAMRLGLDEARALAQLLGEWYSRRRGAVGMSR